MQAYTSKGLPKIKQYLATCLFIAKTTTAWSKYISLMSFNRMSTTMIRKLKGTGISISKNKQNPNKLTLSPLQLTSNTDGGSPSMTSVLVMGSSKLSIKSCIWHLKVLSKQKSDSYMISHNISIQETLPNFTNAHFKFSVFYFKSAFKNLLLLYKYTLFWAK